MTLSNCTRRSRVLLSFGLLVGLSVLGCRPQQNGGAGSKGSEDGSGSDPTSAGQLSQSASAAEITDLRGRGGVQSPDLPDGAFLGIGGKLAMGQRVNLPRGARAELALSTGQKIRINEGGSVRLPTSEAPDTLEVEAGEVVVLCNQVGGMKVRAADDLIEVVRGELHVENRGDARHYSVVHGKSIVKAAGSEAEFELGPGGTLDTPFEKKPDDPNPGPKISLDPLQDAAWADSFEVAKNLAADLPPGIGSLTARQAGSKTDRQSLRLVDQRVQVTITGRVARTEIEQAFHNDASVTMEGIYKFPLPSDASISSLQLLVGNRWIEGEMLEKRRARQIFREIVDATVPRDPALLQWDQGNVFKLNIFPIPAKGERRIRIAYTQQLPAVGDTLRYRYPMAGSGATGNEIENFAFNMTLDGNSFDRAQLENIATPMMDFEREERPDGHFEMKMAAKDFLPTHEMGADIPMPSERQRSESAMYVDRDGQGYFMMSLRPQIPIEGGTQRPVDYAIVLDRSHGTTPELWTTARGLTQSMLATLGEDDHYTVLACDTDCDAVDANAGMRKFDADQLGEVERFLDAQVLAGASDIGGMLEDAALALRKGRPGADKVVIYMGDGAPTSGALTPDELRDMITGPLKDLRVQAVALGARADMLVLDTVVRESGGDLLRADARDDLERLARELRLRAHVPVARDLALVLPPGMTAVYPKKLPSVRPGETVTLVGKLDGVGSRGLEGEIRLVGSGPSGPLDEAFPVRLGVSGEFSHAHLPRTWAQEHLRSLTATQGFAAHDEIVELSRDYNVLSRFTALLVLENDAMFREFGVARKARNKDTWKGELSPADLEKQKRRDEVSNVVTTEVAADEENEDKPSESLALRGQTKGDDGSAHSGAPTAAAPPADAPNFDPDIFDEPGQPAPAEQAQAESEPEPDFFDEDETSGGEESKVAKKESRPTPAPQSKPKSAPTRRVEESVGEAGGGGGMSGLGNKGMGSGSGSGVGRGAPMGGLGGGWHGPVRLPQMRVQERPTASQRTLQRIDQLAAEVDRDPTRRSAHGKLVRAAVAAGHPGVKDFAAAWAESDPDHAPALTAHADVLAAAGSPHAMRAHASAVEVKPFSDKLQRNLADALSNKGDFARACSHRRALVSIDPAKAQHHADLATCLHRDGRTELARQVLAGAQTRVKGSKSPLSKANKALDAPPAPPKAGLHSFPDLKATLTWQGDVDLDIVVVDGRGRRLSATRPEKVRVREEPGVETLTFAKINRPVVVEVTLHDKEGASLPVRAKLVLKTPTGRKTIDLTFAGPGSQRVARLKWD